MPEQPEKRLTTVRTGSFWLLLVIALILVAWGLRATGGVVIPICLAFFIAIALAPLDYRLRQLAPKRFGWAGHLVSMLVIVLILGAFFTGIGLAARQILTKFPADYDSVSELVDAAGRGATAPATAGAARGAEPAAGDRAGASGNDGGSGGEEARADGAERLAEGQENVTPLAGGPGLVATLRSYKGEIGAAVRERGTAYASTIASRTVTFLSSLVVVLFLALFLLIETPHWRDKMASLLAPGQRGEWLKGIEATATNLRHFVLVKSLIGLATAALYSLWLMVMGVDLIFVWFVVTFLLNFIPVIGSVVSAVLAAGYAFFQLDFGTAVIVAVGLLVIEQVMGNFLEPRFLGRQLALSPFVLLASLMFWGWLWGPAGALLATPILILVLSVSAHVRALHPLAIVLAEEGERSLPSIRGEDPVRSARKAG